MSSTVKQGNPSQNDVAVSVWHGSDADLVRLQASVGAHCECKPDEPTCPAHQMLTDQNVLDHINFVRRIRAKLRREEWLTNR